MEHLFILITSSFIAAVVFRRLVMLEDERAAKIMLN